MNQRETEIIQRAAAGDRMAFRLLVDEHGQKMFQLAFRITADSTAAEDVVQEAFISAYRNLPRFNHQAAFGTWMHRITVNAALAYLRCQSRHSKLESGSGDYPLETIEAWNDCPAESAEIRRCTRRAMKSLTDVERAAFTLRHFEGHSIKEISQLLDMNHNACKQAIFRAVKKMRLALAPLVTA